MSELEHAEAIARTYRCLPADVLGYPRNTWKGLMVNIAAHRVGERRRERLISKIQSWLPFTVRVVEV